MNVKVEARPFFAGDSLAARFPPGSKNVVEGPTFGAVLRTTQTQQSEAARELDKYMKMTPEERVAMSLRKQLGISEDEYAAMSPEEKKAVDAKVADLLKQKMDEQIAEQQQKQQQVGAMLKSGITF